MIPRASAFLAVVAAIAGMPASVAAADLRVLAASGVTEDGGLALHTLRDLHGGNRVTFAGSSDAVAVFADGRTQIVARSGDPLPASLGGTLREVTAVAVTGGGSVVFAAAVDSAAASTAFLRLEGDRLVALGRGVGGVTDISVNEALDVAVRRRTGRIDFVPGGGEPGVPIARRGTPNPCPEGGTLRFFVTPPVLNDARTVAFTALTSRRAGVGVFRWTGPGSLECIAFDAGRSLARAPVAINPAGDVAFFARTGPSVAVFVRAADGTATRIAAAGDLVDGVALAGVSTRFVAIDASRRVAFVGRIGEDLAVVRHDGSRLTLSAPLGSSAPVFAPRLTAAGAVAWVEQGTLYRQDGVRERLIGPTDRAPLGSGFAASEPALSENGTVVARLRRSGIYVAEAGGPTRLVSTGDVIDGTGPIVELGSHVSGADGRVAFLATVADGRDILAVLEESGPRNILADGDPVPEGGVVDLDLEDGFDVGTRRVVVNAMVDSEPWIGELDRGGVATLVGPGGTPRGPGIMPAGGPVLAVRGGTVLTAALGDVDTTPTSVFYLRHRRPRPIVLSGNRMPHRAARIVSVDGVVSGGAGIVVQAAVDHPTDGLAFLAWRPGRGLRRLDARGRRAGPRPVVTQFASDGHVVVAVGEPPDGPAGVLLFDSHGMRPLVRSGDPSPLGGTVQVDGVGSLAIAHRRVAFLASLEGAGPTTAILDAPLRRSRSR